MTLIAPLSIVSPPLSSMVLNGSNSGIPIACLEGKFHTSIHLTRKTFFLCSFSSWEMRGQWPSLGSHCSLLYLLGSNGCQRSSSFLSLYSSLSGNRIKIFTAGTAKHKKCSYSLRVKSIPLAQRRAGDATSRRRGREGKPITDT